MLNLKKVKLVALFLVFLLSISSLYAYSFSIDDNKVLPIAHTFETKLANVIWDGKQYVGVGGSFAFTSPDGINWTKHELDSLTPGQIASNGSIIAVSGGFASGKLTYGMSKNGSDWTTVSGGEQNWVPPTKMIYFKNQFFVYLSPDIYISSDGVNYTKKKVSVFDPNKLTPKDYIYLEEKNGHSGLMPSTVVSDGTYLYAAQTDYYGLSILRSSDGIKWDIVCFNKDKNLYSSSMKFVIGNGKYLITLNKNKVFVSSNGKDWAMQDFTRPDMSRVLKNQSSGELDYHPPYVYNYNGIYFTQCNSTKNKVDISTDYKNFYEYTVDREISDILLIDEKYIITEDAVIDYSAAKQDISNGFKNAVISPEKKLETPVASIPPSTVKTNITLKNIKEFEYPDHIGDAIWDGSKYVATGGGYGGYAYSSKDGKTWNTVRLGIHNPADIAFNGGVYTITGGSYIGDLGIASSIDGIKWTALSGKVATDDVTGATIPNATLLWFKGKLFRYVSTEKEILVSKDGSSFVKETVFVTDPYKHIPFGIRELYFNMRSVVSDGTYLYATYRYYMKDSLIRSSDGVNWEVVYYSASDNIGYIDFIRIFNGQYMAFGDDQMIISSDGVNWKAQPSYLNDLSEKDANGKLLPVSLDFYNDYWIIQPHTVKYEETIKSGRIYLTKDLKNFTEYQIEENAGLFIYVDNKVIITNKKVYDSSVIKEFASGTPAGAWIQAVPNSSSVLVNGTLTKFEAYNINGNNYFKLRDIAKVLSGTQKQFEVGWNASENTIELTSGKAYTSDGGEMKVSENLKPVIASGTTSKILLDGKEIRLMAYNINGNNFFKLRDLGEKINFAVIWDEASKTISIDTSKDYTD